EPMGGGGRARVQCPEPRRARELGDHGAARRSRAERAQRLLSREVRRRPRAGDRRSSGPRLPDRSHGPRQRADGLRRARGGRCGARRARRPGWTRRRSGRRGISRTRGAPLAVRRLLHPFVLVVSAVLLVCYAYIAARLTSTAPVRVALATPFIMVWMLPAVFWADRDRRSRYEWIQTLSFLCVGWVSFSFVLTVVRDVLLLATAALPPFAAVHARLDESGAGWVALGALALVGVGALAALRGPYVRRVDIPIEGLEPDLDGMRIVQISDLHTGPTMRRAYVQRVVDMTRELAPDLIALTGDMVDGSVSRLAPRIAPLQALTSGGRAFFVLGNHDYYSGPAPWTAHFEAMGFRVLRNSHVTIARGRARLLIGGVIDFADPDARPRPDLAIDGDAQPAFRLLLAHNPRIAPLAEQAGFDLQLSGHTHAGPVFPW